MKTYLLISMIVAGLATLALASPAESELKALEQQWADAYLKGDTSVLKAIEAEDWSVVDPDGNVLNKAQDIKELGDKTFVVKTSSLGEVKVRMLGENYACVTASSTSTGTYKGEEFSGDYRFLDLFEKNGDKWQAIVSQVTKVKKDDD